MIDDPDQMEIWYQTQLVLARKCEELRGEIRSQCAARALVDGAQRVALMSHNRLQGYTTRAELVAIFADRGPQLRQWARQATRDELAGRVIADRLDAIDAEIARLERLIADNQPSPMWQERQEDASVD